MPVTFFEDLVAPHHDVPRLAHVDGGVPDARGPDAGHEHVLAFHGIDAVEAGVLDLEIPEGDLGGPCTVMPLLV